MCGTSFEDGFHVIGGDTTSELAAFSAEQPFAYPDELAVFFFLGLEDFEAFGVLLFFRVHGLTVMMGWQIIVLSFRSV